MVDSYNKWFLNSNSERGNSYDMNKNFSKLATVALIALTYLFAQEDTTKQYIDITEWYYSPDKCRIYDYDDGWTANVRDVQFINPIGDTVNAFEVVWTHPAYGTDHLSNYYQVKNQTLYWIGTTPKPTASGDFMLFDEPIALGTTKTEIGLQYVSRLGTMSFAVLYEYYYNDQGTLVMKYRFQFSTPDKNTASGYKEVTNDYFMILEKGLGVVGGHNFIVTDYSNGQHHTIMFFDECSRESEEIIENKEGNN